MANGLAGDRGLYSAERERRLWMMMTTHLSPDSTTLTISSDYSMTVRYLVRFFGMKNYCVFVVIVVLLFILW